MSTLFALLIPLAGCATMMFFCTRTMRGGECAADASRAEAAEIAQLRADVAELRARLEPAAADRRAI